MNAVEMFVLYSKQTAKNKYTGHRSSPGQQLLWKERLSELPGITEEFDVTISKALKPGEQCLSAQTTNQ